MCAGQVDVPGAIGRGGLFFVPQRPYITLGGLRKQVPTHAVPPAHAVPSAHAAHAALKWHSLLQVTYPNTIEYDENTSDEYVVCDWHRLQYWC